MSTDGQSQRSSRMWSYIYPYLLQGVEEKLCFFTTHCNPSLAHNLQSYQRHASVQSLLLAVQPITTECCRGRGGKLLRILENKTNTIFNEHPVTNTKYEPLSFLIITNSKIEPVSIMNCMWCMYVCMWAIYR